MVSGNCSTCNNQKTTAVFEWTFSLLASLCIKLPRFESCIHQRRITCPFSIRKLLVCSRASKLSFSFTHYLSPLLSTCPYMCIYSCGHSNAFFHYSMDGISVQWEKSLVQHTLVGLWKKVMQFYSMLSPLTLRWRHNERDCISNHQPHGCLLNR